MKVKHGKSLEITDQLNSDSAKAIAQWIGCATVISNQKTIQSKSDYAKWLLDGKPADSRPESNTQVAHLCKDLTFLKDIPSQIRRNAGAKWFEALSAAKIGLRKHPRLKPKHKKRNCYVTSELFDIQALDDERCLVQLKHNDKKTSKGRYLAGFVMPFAKEDAANSFFLSRKGNRFWLSMTYSVDVNSISEAEVKAKLVEMTDDELSEALTGYDLGVKRQVTGSDGKIYHLSKSAIIKLKEIEARKVRYQRRYARVARANDRTKGTVKRERTNGEKKLSKKIAKYSEKKACIQKNNAHHISKEIAENTPLAGVFEGMRISNLVRKAKAKQDPITKKWLRNGAAAKTGLNKAILDVNMGQIRQFTKYKLADQGKILIKVKTAYSSQECSKCGFTDKGNRTSQAVFKCLSCKQEMNADDNASAVIKARGFKHVRTEAFSKEKTVRKISARKKNSSEAHELASLGSGDNVSLVFLQATVDEALNQRLTISPANGLSEARML
jgi:putative transposase